jgi:hypothetical protein
MSELSTTPAEIFLGLGGKVCNLVGLGFVSVGGVYAVNKLSHSAIRILESIPSWVTGKTAEEAKDSGKQVVITRDDVGKAFRAYGTLIGIILAGTGLGVFGRYISSEAAIKGANALFL